MRRTATFALLALALACKHPEAKPAGASKTLDAGATSSLAPNERLITILGTNDMHGGLEPEGFGEARVGGVAILAGIVSAIRTGLATQHGERAGVLLLDGGDQFQGTLISNYSEGRGMFRALGEAGYDAAVPGNHDFDFGPVGWLEDVVLPTTAPENANPRGALLRAAELLSFPLLSSNTYERSSLEDASGAKVEVVSSGCRPKNPSQQIVWEKAKRPAFVKPYVVKEVAGVRIGIIGLDHVDTAETTQSANVRDLCFRDATDSFLAARAELDGQVDLAVMIAHDGNFANVSHLKKSLGDILQARDDAVDAVVSGHSHLVELYEVAGVPVVQSGSGGLKFGRIDLIYDVTTKKVLRDKTRWLAGLEMKHATCAPEASAFCDISTTHVLYEGAKVIPSTKVEKIIQESRAEIGPIAERSIGKATAEIKRSRKEQSPLAQALVDLLREASQADVAIINSATVRDTLPKGALTYEHLYKTLPFSSRTLRLTKVDREHLVKLALDMATKSGEYGIMVQSGLEITFKKEGGTPKLVKLAKVGGETIFPAPEGAGPGAYTIVALDFLCDQVSGVDGLKGVAVEKDLGVFRELIAEVLVDAPKTFATTIDKRVKEL